MKRIKLLSIIFSTMIFVRCANKTGEEYYKMAKDLDEKGSPKKAFMEANKAIKKDPSNYKYYILKAEARYHGWVTSKGSTENVMADYNKALDYKPFSIEVFKSRWKYFEFIGDKKNMLIDLERVLKSDSANTEAWLKVGQLNFLYNDTTRGYYCFKKAETFTSNRDSVQMFLADSEFEAQLFRRAKNRYLQLLDHTPKVNFNRYTSLSMAYWNMNNRDSACFYFRYVDKAHLYGKLFEISENCK